MRVLLWRWLGYNGNMSVAHELSHTKTRYRQLFAAAQEALAQRLFALLPECHPDPSGYKTATLDDLLVAPTTDPYLKNWAQRGIHLLETEIGGEILTQLRAIEAAKQTVQCHQCGVCCRFASSEFSYDELVAKAQAGDSFATQFTSIFLPYASIEAAREKFPAMVADVLNHTDDAVYFYHCPYVGEDNRCTLWGKPKRPPLCQNYPDTPLTFIYKNCAWKPWKDDNHDDALAAHASIELCGFYVGRLKTLLAA